jgi:hypothetical protein
MSDIGIGHRVEVTEGDRTICMPWHRTPDADNGTEGQRHQDDSTHGRILHDH